MSNTIQNPYDHKIKSLENELEKIRNALFDEIEKRNAFNKNIDKVDEALKRWMQKIAPYRRDIGATFSWSSLKGIHPNFSKNSKFYGFRGIAIYAHWTQGRNPHDFLRGPLKINNYAEYLNDNDFESIPLTFVSENVQDLLPDDEFLNEYINYKQIIYSHSQGKYVLNI